MAHGSGLGGALERGSEAPPRSPAAGLVARFRVVCILLFVWSFFLPAFPVGCEPSPDRRPSGPVLPGPTPAAEPLRWTPGLGAHDAPGEVLMGYQAATLAAGAALTSWLGLALFAPNAVALALFYPRWARWFRTALAVALVCNVTWIAVAFGSIAMIGFWVWCGSMCGIAVTSLGATTRSDLDHGRVRFPLEPVDLMVFAGIAAGCAYVAGG